MGRLVDKLVALVAYLCIATLMAAGGGVAYLRSTGKLDNEKLKQILAVMQGVELANAKPDAAASKPADNDQQVSFEEREEAREVQARHLQMREQAIKNGLDRVRFEQRVLTEEKDRYERLETNFRKELKDLREGALLSGKESVRLIWENIKPKQAKEQILQMLENQEISDVVAILSAMPIAKRAKIVSEFKSPDEAKKLDEILRLIRQGSPEVNLIDKTEEQIKQE